MDESIYVASIIDKLPPLWKDFKHTLKHNKDELSLVQLGSHFRIKETLRAKESGKGKGKEIVGSSSVNMIEDCKNKKNNKNTKGNKRNHDGNNDESNKKSKLTCWKCGKTGHFKRDCHVKKNNGGNTSSSRQGYKNPNPSQDDAFAWWIDSGATCHACKDRCWFEIFHPVQDGFVLHMGDESTKPILGHGNVVLEFSFGKIITLVNVVHGVFVGFGYYNNDRGGEYYDPVYFQSIEIIHETTAPYTPQQNGVSERKNKALKEMINSMLSYSGLSEGFWGEAMSNRERVDISFGFDFQLYLVEGSRDKIGTRYSYCYGIEEDSRMFDEAMQSCDVAF
ncbi:zinc finger, CCHC-type containing protein [Tanacetum coccineum]